MFLKVHRSPGSGDIVAVCDHELLNTTLCHGTVSVRISEAFYGNARASEDEVRAALKNAETINLMGKRSVGVGIGMGLVTPSGCLMIGEIPHAQVYLL